METKQANPQPTRFEDLAVWQKARDLVREVYQTTRCGPLVHEVALPRQVQRAADARQRDRR